MEKFSIGGVGYRMVDGVSMVGHSLFYMLDGRRVVLQEP